MPKDKTTNEPKPKKEKKIIISEEVDDRVNGLSVAIAFVFTGLILTFSNNYFGSQIVSNIIKWLFIGVGILGLIVEIPKQKKYELKGESDLGAGLFCLAIWAACFFLVDSPIARGLTFLIMFFGIYETVRGLSYISYSIKHMPNKQDKEKSKMWTSAFILLTKLAGLVLVVIQIVQLLKK